MSKIYPFVTLLGRVLSLMIVGSFFFFLQAQQDTSLDPCTIVLDNIGEISIADGATVCANEPITFPELAFNDDGTFVAAGIVWSITMDPPNPTLTAMPDVLGDILFNGGVGVFENAGFDYGTDGMVSVCVVPVLVMDTTNNAGATFDLTCTGIDNTFNYPCFTFLNPEDFPDVCDSQCDGSFEENDECIMATALDITTNDEQGPYYNICATSMNDPDFPTGEACFFDDDAYENTVWFGFTGNGGTYSIATINCTSSDSTDLSDSQMAIYSGDCDTPVFEACNEDDTDLLAAINDFVTTAGTEYFVLVDGFDDNVGEFCLQVTEVSPPPVCEANAGTPDLMGLTDICEEVDIMVSVSGNNTSADYTTVLVILDENNQIVSADQVFGTSFNLTSGTYQVLTYNHANTSTPTFTVGADTSTVVAACAAWSAASDLNVLPADDPICTPPMVCDAAFGQISTSDDTESCVGETISINTTGGNTTTEYTNAYIANSGDDANVVAFDIDGNFDLAVGTYTIHGINYLNTDEMALAAFINTAPLVGDLIDSLNAAVYCAALNVANPITVTILPSFDPDCCTADFGTVVFDTETVICPPDSGTGQTIDISTTGANADGYTTVFVITTDDQLNILGLLESTSDLPTGSYTLHAFNFNDEQGELVNDILDITDVTAQAFVDSIANGSLCATLDVTGQAITVLGADDPACFDCSAISIFAQPNGETSLCVNAASTNVEVAFTENFTNSDFTSYLVITESDGTIVGLTTGETPVTGGATALNFADFGLLADNYNVHAFLHHNDDIDVVVGLTGVGNSANDLVNALIEGSICGDLQLPGVEFTLLSADNEACDDCQANIGTVNASPETFACSTDEVPVFVVGNQTGDYSTQFIVVDAAGDVTFTMANPLEITEVGMYTLHAINYLTTDEAAVTSISSLSDLADLEACFDWDEIGAIVTILPETSLQCCGADFGTVVPNEDVTICIGQTVGMFSVIDAATEGYTSTFLVTQEGSLLGTSSDLFANPMDFTALGAGTYTFHALNYNNLQAASVLELIADGTLPLADTLCTALDIEGVEVTVLSANNPNCLDPLTAQVDSTIVADNGLTYSVYISIGGGSGSYVVNGNPIDGNLYTNVEIPCGTPYNFVITDENATGTVTLTGDAPCAFVCISDAGTMPSFDEPVPVCAGGIAVFTNLGDEVLDLTRNDILVYALHTSSGTTAGTILSVNPDEGAFSQDSPLFGVTPIASNVVYYISAVVGPTDDDGNLILTDECLSVAAGIPVVFLDPITFEVDENCNFGTGDYEITVTLSGGYPEFNSNAAYTISGEFAPNPTVSGINPTFTAIIGEGQASTYSFAVLNDGADCLPIEIASTEPFTCIKTPIELISFSGKAETRGNLLRWTTGTEVNNDYFQLRRSLDGQTFETITTIDGAGNSTSARSYDYMDEKAPVGTSYYQLLQVDFNGTSTKSDVISLNRKELELNFNIVSVYPVPADDSVNINFISDNDAPVVVQVYDLIGKLLTTKTFDAQKGNNILELDIRDYSSGIYFMQMTKDKEVLSRQFIKE